MLVTNSNVVVNGSKCCAVSKYITETDTFFTSTVTGKACKINHHFDCNDKCLFYLLTCNKCKRKYTGQTTVDGTTTSSTSLKVEVLLEENSACKNICTDILKVKVIQVSVMTFL